MRAFKHILWVGVVAFAMTFTNTAQAQFAIGLQGGANSDTNETVGGLIARYSFGNIVVGANLEYGSWTETYDSDQFAKRAGAEFSGSAIHFNIPLAYVFALGEGDFSVFPFVQVGTVSWDEDDCEAVEGFEDFCSGSETTFDGGVGAQYKFIFVTAGANLLGDEDGWSKYIFRIGGVYGL